MRVNRPAQAQAPRWPMSLEMEMFPKKLPGRPPSTRVVCGGVRMNHYNASDSSVVVMFPNTLGQSTEWKAWKGR